VAKQQRLQVEIPSAARGQAPRRAGRPGGPRGAVVGLLWPWLTGIKLVPEPPVGITGGSRPVGSSGEPSTSARAAAPPPRPGASAEKPAEAEPAAPKRLRVAKLTVISCRDGKDRRVDKCDELAFDRIALPRFAALENCPAAGSAQECCTRFGVGSIEQQDHADRERQEHHLRPALRSPGQLRQKEFQAASLDGLKHEHASYTLFYRIGVSPPANRQRPTQRLAGFGRRDGGQRKRHSGLGAAIIRDAPSKDGRISRGHERKPGMTSWLVRANGTR